MSSHIGRLSSRKSAIGDCFVFLAGAIAVLYPVALAYFRFGPAAPFKFFASDAFYYLNVARRSQGQAFFTYDGTHATNGFHPLWQWLLTGLFWATNSLQASDRQTLLDYAVCATLAAVGVGLLAVCSRRLIGSSALAVIFTIPGLFEILFSNPIRSTIDSTEAAPWFVVNGMESSLSLLWFGLFVWQLLRRPSLKDWSLTRFVLLSALLTLLTLSRLDDIFLLAACGGAVVLASAPRRRTLSLLVALGAVPLLSLSAYLVYNFNTTGMLVPVSASMKRDLGALAGNLRDVLQTVVPSRMLSAQQLFVWDALNWRALQLCLPMLIALVFIAYRLFVRHDPHDSERRGQQNVLTILAAYVVMKGAYNLVSVQFLSQGHWYFTLSIASANLMLTFLAGELGKWRRPELVADLGSRARHATRATGSILLVVGGVLAIAAYNRSRLVFALMFVALPGAVCAFLPRRLLDRVGATLTPALPGLGRASLALLAAAYLVMQSNAVVNQKVSVGYNEVNFEFWQARQRINAELARISPTAKLVELDDGVMAYALDLPTMSGTGLAVDAEAFAECRAERCMDVAFRRGFRIISSVQYWSYANEQRKDFRRPVGEPQILESLVGSQSFEPPHGAERFEFSVLLAVDIGSHVVYFLQFKPRV